MIGVDCRVLGSDDRVLDADLHVLRVDSRVFGTSPACMRGKLMLEFVCGVDCVRWCCVVGFVLLGLCLVLIVMCLLLIVDAYSARCYKAITVVVMARPLRPCMQHKCNTVLYVCEANC